MNFRLFLALLSTSAWVMAQEKPIYQNKQFAVYSNRVVQGKYEAKANSATSLTSNYQSPANLFQSADISFKFAINGKDNEMLPGKDHHFSVMEGKAITPMIVFGQQTNAVSGKKAFLKPETPLTIRLDFRKPLQEMNEKGYYTCFNGTKIYKQDFKGVFVAGSAAPLTWDFDNLHQRKELELLDKDGDGIYETTIILNAKVDKLTTDNAWTLQKDLTAFPMYQSPYVLNNALFNLSLEEMIKAVEPDSTFRTGKEWGGVWTRDISYSIILAMAHLQPQVAKNSLLRKVNKKKKIIQDTGTGGAWPASTDRMIWAVAAWEVYKVTGDENWLNDAYTIVKNSIEDDEAVAYDAVTGLVKGESSFLDWREQTYPKWMQPADIFESECLGTNAVHYQANIVLSKMATILKQQAVAQKHFALAETIKKGINKYLWMPDKGYYAQFLYGRTHKMVSPRSEALGEALCVIFGIADEQKAQQIIAQTPVTNFGISCIYPQIPGLPPYHNNAVWPFVQTYWMWAAAKQGNEASVLHSMASISRAAALFLTNKENFVADNGDFKGTVINSSIMLWSLSGNISMVEKVLFGMQFLEDKLIFKPFVPSAYKGIRSLNNVPYRNTKLNITVEGYGNQIQAFYLDGQLMKTAEVPAILHGNHTVRMILSSKPYPQQPINLVENYTTISTPQVQLLNNQLSWEKVAGAVAYQVIKNGKPLVKTTHLTFTINANEVAEYQVIALDKKSVPSFASEPVNILPNSKTQTYYAANYAPKANYQYQGHSGFGFVEIAVNVNPSLTIPIDVPTDGTYLIDVKYANGNGPTNTENKCAIRTLMVDNTKAGTLVFPQRGKDEWSNWGFSNSVQLPLTKGKHTINLLFDEHNHNMNENINQAMIDYVRIVSLKQ